MKTKRIMSIDAETDGLYGPVLAVAGIVYEDRRETTRFVGRMDDDHWPKSGYVADHIRPACAGIADVYRDREPTCFQNGAFDRSLLSDFGAWYLQYKTDVIVVAHMPCPVEAGVFIRMRQLGIITDNDGPYPLYDVATMLATARGYRVDLITKTGETRPLVTPGTTKYQLFSHYPLACVAGRAAVQADRTNLALIAVDEIAYDPTSVDEYLRATGIDITTRPECRQMVRGPDHQFGGVQLESQYGGQQTRDTTVVTSSFTSTPLAPHHPLYDAVAAAVAWARLIGEPI